jgi:ABC-type transport system involved in multi-copper enzyme maturation permease subunit
MSAMARLFARLYLPVLDPVFLKDLEGLSRRWRLYVGRMVYIALVGLTLYLFLGRATGVLSTSASAELGRALFTGLLTVQMVYVTIVMAHLAADLLLREARSGTLQLMLLTPLSGWRIALGKWKAVMAQASTLILAGLPPLGITAYLGGVGPWELLWSTSLSLSLAGLSSALALYAALKARTAVRAAAAATGTIFLTGVTLLVVFGVVYGLTGSPWVIFAAGLLHPVAAAVGAAFTGYFGGIAGYGWIGATILSLAASQVFLMSAAGHLSISSTLDDLLAPRGLAPSERTADPQTFERRVVSDRHPLLWREQALYDHSGLNWTRRLAIVLLCSVMVFLLMPKGKNEFVLEVWLVPLTGLAMAAGAGLFIRDKENRHLEVLLTLPVTSGEVVGAKLVSRIGTIEGAACLLPSFLLFQSWFGFSALTGLSLATLVLCFSVFSYVLAALASLHVETSRAAFLLAASVVWGALFGLPLLRETVPPALLAFTHPVVMSEVILGGHGADPVMIGAFVLVYSLAIVAMIATMVRRFRLQLR